MLLDERFVAAVPSICAMGTGRRVFVWSSQKIARSATWLAPQDRRAIDAFEQQHGSLFVLTRYNDTATSLRSFFNRRLPLWEGYTRYALDDLVDGIAAAQRDCGALGRAVIRFMGEVGVGFTASGFGNVFGREIREGCAIARRGKPAKLQELARLLFGSSRSPGSGGGVAAHYWIGG